MLIANKLIKLTKNSISFATRKNQNVYKNKTIFNF